jgi:hypothetical protein
VLRPWWNSSWDKTTRVGPEITAGLMLLKATFGVFFEAGNPSPRYQLGAGVGF